MLIHTNDQLKKFYLKCQKHEVVAVDTEFYRVNTYYPKFCLLQMANKDETILIDPINKKLDLSLIKKILYSSKILKVFHAAQQDLEIFFNLYKELPKNIIDTQICINFAVDNIIIYIHICRISHNAAKSDRKCIQNP